MVLALEIICLYPIWSKI